MPPDNYREVRTAFDPDKRHSSRFHYDKLGRLVVSQNARQRNSAQRKYSYTIYDNLGRVVEVGEKTENNQIANQTLGVFYFRDVFGSQVSGHYNPLNRSGYASQLALLLRNLFFRINPYFCYVQSAVEPR